jgi:D-3-phosphoglycerate dehydrogenase / 2-oxoglutarate reductase
MALQRSAPQDVRVLLLENIHPDATAILTKAGYQVATADRALPEDELLARLAEVDVLGVRSTTQVPARAFEAAPHLLAVGAFCIGTNQIDVSAASAQGVAVFNAPFSNTRSVVELVVAEIISLQRGLTDKTRKMHEGVWDKSAKGSHEVRGRRLGIVGYGNIGSQLSVLAEALGMSVWFYDSADKLALGNAKRCSSLEELLETVDIVTLHVDGRPTNRGLFTDAEFSRMVQGSIFLNLSRGFVVDHAALRAHIESGHIVGAAIDVFPSEPKRRNEPFVSELRGLANVILTPHVGGSTEEAQQDIGRFVAGKLNDYLEAGSTALSVNLPNLVLPAEAGEFRLTHVHANVPGVLAAVDSLFASHGMNIEGQYLGTRGDIGYVITDTPTDFAPDLLEAFNEMPATIRLRVL